jgi:hypothetical protein
MTCARVREQKNSPPPWIWRDGRGGSGGRGVKMSKMERWGGGRRKGRKWDQGGTVAAPEGGSRRDGEGGGRGSWGGVSEARSLPLFPPPPSKRRVYLTTSIATSPPSTRADTVFSPPTLPPFSHATHVYVSFSFHHSISIDLCTGSPQHRKKQSIDVPTGRLTDATDGGAYAAR